MNRALWALGLATCQLPLVLAVVVGWWSPWAGVLAGAVVSVVAGILWARRARQSLLGLAIFAGLAFSVMGASLLLPTLRLLSGTLPTYRLGTPSEGGGGPPMAVDFLTIEGGAPRSDMVHVGDVYQTRGEAGVSYLYSVVAPVVRADWEPSAPVPAWAICEVSRRSDEAQQSARQECVERFERPNATYEREGFDADLPNAPMVAEAMEAHELSQAEDAPIFVQRLPEDVWQGIVVPLVFLLVSLGGVRSAVKKYGESTPTLEV